MKYVHVLVEYQALEKEFLYTYEKEIALYTRVKINFNNKDLIGFVVKVEDWYPVEFQVKPILEVIDETPLLNKELVQLAKWLQTQYFTTAIRSYQQILPQKLRPSSTASKPKQEKHLKLKQMLYKTQKQKEALLFLQENEGITKKAFTKLFKSLCNTLINMGAIEVYEKDYEAQIITSTQKAIIDYTDDQKKAISTINQLQAEEIALLHGVTASGKSEVFYATIQKQLELQKQVLILVPEISLVSQMVRGLMERFQSSIALYHSSLNDQEKYEQYQLVKNHKVNVIVGTRSAIFLPFKQLGLIIIDEEHDQSYIQDHNIRYNTKDVAIKRCEYHKCPLVLASATPSINAYAKAYKKRYKLIEMKHKVFDVQRNIMIVDMMKQARNQKHILSQTLENEIEKTLANNQQVMLILNKRGYANYVKCLNCGEVLQCKNCDVALKYHSQDKKMKCHICEYEEYYTGICKNCGSMETTFYGIGTQKLEEYTKTRFPNAKIARLDKDTTKYKNALKNTLEKFENNEYQILIGTQMLSKGLDFANVGLVGIINGDDLLSRTSYKSVELMYQLLVQSFGRSGRKKTGNIVLQVYDINHYAIKSAVLENYQQFFKQEMYYRHLANYPPYVYLASITLLNSDIKQVQDDAQYLRSIIKTEVLGPSELYRIHNYHRIRFVFKSKDMIKLQQQLKFYFDTYKNMKRRSKIEIDFNCEDL